MLDYTVFYSRGQNSSDITLRTSNTTKDILLLHNDACPDTAFHIVKMLGQLHIEILKYSLYSPTLLDLKMSTIQPVILSYSARKMVPMLWVSEQFCVYLKKILIWIFFKCTVKMNGSVVMKVRVAINLKPSLSEPQYESDKVVQQFLHAFISDHAA
jgi:hypothetical protein